VTAVAFLGLGAMGAPMARRIVLAGHDVTVWNRTAARAEPLAAAGARVGATAAEAARAADVVVTMLSDASALEAVTRGEDGVLGALRRGAVLVEMSTAGPAAIAELAARMPPGAALVDAPVLGSVTEASEGSLRIFVGGEQDAYERVAPLLDTLGDPVRVGPLGSGAAAKLVANSTLFAVVAALGEAIALGDAYDLPRDVVFDVLERTPLGPQAGRRRESIETRTHPPRFTLALARKDAELVAAAAGEREADLRVANAAMSWLVEADDAGLGAHDYSAVLAHILGERPGN
jgi:3-hydroxyisobutyrate dehydrogenase-like beta-hydroxyacid dehydrogenase